MSFDTITGHEKPINHLKRLLKNNRIPAGLLFCGESGIGKKLTALAFARILNCLDEKAAVGQQSCGKCEGCVSAGKNIHPDITLADFDFQAQLLGQPPEKQQHIRIETIRELTGRAQQKRLLGNWKVFIVDRAETMLMGSGNALLKLLEEPPPGTLWILVTAKKSAMLSTILSRCQTITFAPLTQKETQEILLKNKFSHKQAQVLADFSQGSIEKAYRIKEIFEKFSALDPADINFPFEVSDTLPKELAAARSQARILIELLITTAHKKWKGALPKNKDKIKEFIKKLYKFETYLNRNVSVHRITQLSFLDAEKLGINPFSGAVNLV